MQRFKAICQYDGTDWHGWQSQHNDVTLQDCIQARLVEILQHPTPIHASGRTDQGVHAKGQVFHFDANWKHSTAELLRALQSRIPRTLRVTELQAVDSNFHARFSARSKCYSYTLLDGYASPFEYRYCWEIGRYRIEYPSLTEAFKCLEGTHDFTAFSADRGDGKPVDPVRTVYAIHIERHKRQSVIHIRANGFLYKMARRLVGGAIELARGKLSIEALVSILKSGQRSHLIPTAPPQGLCLERVYYVDPPR